ncbi:hybrid sensor histidine kinase/response regulator [Methylophilus luteus]|uniref:histidine kinase n=1 Tax=Methylophilus luteus TaxID=640108 RepID=A0ABW3F5D2_9PROT
MQANNNISEQDSEVKRLRLISRDLIAISTLPAIWGSLKSEGVIKSLCNVLFNTLDLDLIYIRWSSKDGENEIETLRTLRDGESTDALDKVRTALAPFLQNNEANQAADFPDPFGEESLRLNFVRFGIALDNGVIVAGSKNAAFPTERDRLLMGVGANQAAVVLLRQQTENALHKSEKRFNDFAQTAPAILWATESNGICSFLTSGWYEFTGQPKNNGLGFGWLDAVHDEDREAVRLVFADAHVKSKEFTCEHRILHSDGTYHWVINTGRPNLSSSNQLLGMVGNVLDITHRKLLEEKIKLESDRKDEFLAMLAHELRNPLAPIASSAELLRLLRPDDEQVLKTSGIIGRQVSHMSNLINDLLDVSRVTRGSIDLERKPVEINKVIADAVEQVNPFMLLKKHELIVNVPAAPSQVLGDNKRLVQILSNLLNNAAKYTPNGGRIVLNTMRQDTDLLIEITDNGMGMSPSLVSQAFDLFVQAELSSDRSSGGLGIGLTVVKSLVELHGGKVWAESDGIDLGSKFSVSIPLLIEPSEKPDQDALSISQELSQPLKVLVVDDNVDAAEVLAMVLEAEGHLVLIEHNSIKALELAYRELPDVCLLDIGLPEIDGYEIARRLRINPETKDIKLIATTGYGGEDDKKAALAAGFDLHLVKPLDFRVLAEILKDLKINH